MIHVIPLNDEKEHEDTSACWCEPTVEWEHPEPVCVHNSADGRELIEQAEELLDQTE